MKIKLFFSIGFFLVLGIINVEGQNKYGKKPSKCKTNLSIFNEYSKNGNFTEAYEPWKWCIDNCPQSSKLLYKYGIEILESYYKQTQNETENHKLLEELEILNTMSIKYFPDTYGEGNDIYCFYSKNEVDEFTGEIKKILKPKIIGKSKSNILKSSLALVENNYFISLTFSGDLGCVTDDSYIIIKFEDGSTQKLFNISDIDCKESPKFVTRINSVYKELEGKKIDKIRLGLSEKYADIIIDNKSFIIKSLQCLKK